MATIADDLAHDLAEAKQLASVAGNTHPNSVLAALDRFANLIIAIDNVRPEASDETKELIRRALQLGVDQRDLYGRPFSSTVVRDIAAEMGLNVSKTGPRRRTKPHVVEEVPPA